MGEDEVQLDLLDGEDEEIALPGFRFHPTDEELVGFYLPRKVEKKRFRIDFIKQLDVYKYDPWDLAMQSTCGVGENEWYFFCLRGRKYRNSVRPNRVTESGYWKATGTDKKIMFPSGSNNCTGLKKSLVYYSGKGGKGTKTCWMMHEFRLLPKENESSKDPKSINPVEAHETEKWTICKIFHRNVSSRKKSQPQEETESAERAKSDHSNPKSSVVDSTESEYPYQIQLLLDNSFDIEEEMEGSTAINISIDDYNIEEQQQSTEESTVLNISIEDYMEEQQCCGVMIADVLPSDGDPCPNILSPFGIDGCDFMNWDHVENILF